MSTQDPARPAITRGRFITFEGIEGVGKSTQVALTAAALAAVGETHLVTREPGGTPLAERIRALVLDAGGEPVPPIAELLLMFAARSIHLSNRILPALTQGIHVLCDRFTDATYAYQGAGRGADAAMIASLERGVQGTVQPDLTLLLDLPVAAALKRASARGAADRFESEREEFFHRVRAGYLARAAADPKRFAIVDAAPPQREVQAQIRAVVASRFNMEFNS